VPSFAAPYTVAQAGCGAALVGDVLERCACEEAAEEETREQQPQQAAPGTPAATQAAGGGGCAAASARGVRAEATELARQVLHNLSVVTAGGCLPAA
jgi:hypothetical protein